MRTTLWVAAATVAVASAAVLAARPSSSVHAAPAPALSGAPPASAIPAPAPAAPTLPPAFTVVPDSVAAPDFSVPTLDGDTFRLADQRGKVVVLNFWATWCPPCRIEIPDFVRVREELRGRDVVFVGVSVDDEASAVRPAAVQLGITYAVAHDDGSVQAAYGPLASLPTTFIIGPDGNVFAYAPGMLSREALRAGILAALGTRS